MSSPAESDEDEEDLDTRDPITMEIMRDPVLASDGVLILLESTNMILYLKTIIIQSNSA